MAEHLEPSPKGENKSTKKIEKSISKEEAADVLLSAIDILKNAHLRVTGYNDSDRLILCIEGLNYSAGDIYPVPRVDNKVAQTITETKPNDPPPARSESKGVT